jgi:hypothetical protein
MQRAIKLVSLAAVAAAAIGLLAPHAQASGNADSADNSVCVVGLCLPVGELKSPI